MVSLEDKKCGRARLESGGRGEGFRGRGWRFWLLPIGGLAALIWFLLRVIPKPSRASYPCQRLAFPLASGFVIWVSGAIASVAAIRRARGSFARRRYVLCAMLIAISIGAVWLAQGLTGDEPAAAQEVVANSPIGTAKGIHPGRVAWVHDPDSTDWAGPGEGHWWESEHTAQAVVDSMVERAVRGLAGESTSSAAWDRIFKHFNETHGKGKVGYKSGEKIVVKVNFVGCIAIYNRRPVTSREDYDLRSVDYMNTAPQMINAVLKQLVEEAGVKQGDITVGDPLCYFPNEYYKICHDKYPDVRYLEHLGKFGRTAAKFSSVPFYWSTASAAGKKTDYVPASYVDAAYLINLANLKSHNDMAGITLCAKNHYGSLLRSPRDGAYYDMHKDLSFRTPGMGHYRPLVDLMGHKHVGGKTLLYLIDGLYAGKHAKERAPRKWEMSPFNGDWTSSVFASQDAVAIDSVGYDFLRSEWDDAPRKSGTNDYLIEAAKAGNPPSGAFYDPDHESDVKRLASLGVYENWNNAKDMEYSRNLGTGEGIELVKVGVTAAAEN